jgi:hypothetical protein
MRQTGIVTRFGSKGSVTRAALGLLAGILGSGCAEGRKPFCIVALPDTQYYSGEKQPVFQSQTQWIVDHRKELNIVCVVHEGDITDRNSEPQWQGAVQAMRVLDGVVPVIVVPGNHDTAVAAPPTMRGTSGFRKHFPASEFAKRPWYGGHLGEGIENSYLTFRAAGIDFLVMGLEFGPRDEAIAWANEVVSKHPGHRVILVTHCYMNFDETRVGKGDKHNPHTYRFGGYDGDEMWEKLVSRHGNIDLVLSGHILGDGVGRLTSAGEGGHPVHQLLANYQMRKDKGGGYLRILKFVPEEGRIYVSTYSPWLKQEMGDEQNQFVLEYDMRAVRGVARGR